LTPIMRDSFFYVFGGRRIEPIDHTKASLETSAHKKIFVLRAGSLIVQYTDSPYTAIRPATSLRR
jgi:hypothetical protein